MRGSVLLSSGLALGLVCLVSACATTVDVSVDESEELSRLHTWNWLPAGPAPEMGVVAHHRDPSLLQARLARLIEARLRAQGFVRGEHADFFVIYHLLLTPREEAVQVPRAAYLLSSMNSSPSYWIEGTDEEVQPYEDFRLVIGLMTGSDRLLWKGVLERKVDDGKDLALDEAVTRLLEDLPPSRPAFEGDPPTDPPASPQEDPAHPIT